MSVPGNNDIAEVVQRVQAWPAPQRIALARRILETLEGPPPSGEPPRLPRAVGRRSRGHVPDRPAGATVRQWIDEHRREKYDP